MKHNQRMVPLAKGQLGRLKARFFNVLVSLHFRSALQSAPYACRYVYSRGLCNLRWSAKGTKSRSLNRSEIFSSMQNVAIQTSTDFLIVTPFFRRRRKLSAARMARAGVSI